MANLKSIVEVLKIVVEGEKVISEGDNVARSIANILKEEWNLPNFQVRVMDRGIFWNDIAEYEGWKFQQNTFTKSA